MEKSILDMFGGEKHINPRYDIKAESTGCKGFTGIEINGVRFSNIGEMLRYMDKQREQLIKAKKFLKTLLEDYVSEPEVFPDGSCEDNVLRNLIKEMKQFLKENE